jgi:phosphoglycolate phosphatase
VADRFDFVAGFDSGYGAKPDPGPLLAFARAVDLPPARIVMVGDSAHDMSAGRAAGMVCVAVGGIPSAVALADANLPDISALADWIDSRA